MTFGFIVGIKNKEEINHLVEARSDEKAADAMSSFLKDKNIYLKDITDFCCMLFEENGKRITDSSREIKVKAKILHSIMI